MIWTDAKIEKLKSLWGRGITAGDIAKQLGDVSRNAVIGKAHRLGLSSQPSGGAEKSKAVAKASVAKKAAAPVKAAPVAKQKAAAPAPAKAKATAPAKAVAKAAPPAKVEVKAKEVAVAKAAVKMPPVSNVPVEDRPVARAYAALSAVMGAAASERACKWPIGDPRKADFHFCCASAEPGFPYCYEHACMAYQSSSRKRPTDEDKRAA